MRSLIFLLALLMTSASAVGAEPRTWTSAGGKFKIEDAVLVKTEEGSDGKTIAVIRKKDGKELRVPLDKLSEADQAYVASQNKTDAEEPVGEPAKDNSEEPEPRTWTSANGKFKIESATFLKTESDASGDNTIVVIKKKDGKPLRVPLKKLSWADQQYVKKLTEEEFALPKFVPEPKPAEPSTPPETPDTTPEQPTEPPKPKEPEITPLPPATAFIEKSSPHAASLFPTDMSKWINLDTALTPEAVGNKAIVIVEATTTLSQKETARVWAQRLRSVQSYRDDPVIFVAVLSGLSKKHATTYLSVLKKKAKLTIPWPFLIDTNGEFSQAIGKAQAANRRENDNDDRDRDNGRSGRGPARFPQLPSGSRSSTRGDVRGIDGNGKVVNRRLYSAAAAADALTSTARWRVDPKGMPEAMRKTWLKIEYGRYKSAASAIGKGLDSKNPDQRRHFERMFAVIKEKIDALAMRGERAMSEGNKAHAYRAYDLIIQNFGKYEIDEKIQTAHNKLKNDLQLEDEIAAFAALDKAMRLSRPKSRRSALNSVISKYPDTTAAKDADILLERSR